jgi:2-dehydro-3-deoxyphosphooctonate aldolase (KDO 8-P synthase)
VLEEEALVMQVAEEVAAAARNLGIFFIFKSSYLKDNRTAADSFTGPGLDAGLRTLARVRREVGVPVLTDVHGRDEVAAVAEVADVLQVPAFLCRQSRLLAACAQSGRAVNIKKGQFLAPADMAHAVAKARAANPHVELLLTERGSCFGYRDLVVDMRAVALMRALGCRVVFDATHALQRPGAGGDRRFAAALARAALGAGAEGIFAEVHPDPARARSDATTQLPLASLPALLEEWLRLGTLVAQLEEQGLPGGPDWPGLEAPPDRGASENPA